MMGGQYVSLEQFKELLFNAEIEQLSCWRGFQMGHVGELVQCFKYRNIFYIRRNVLGVDACLSFPTKEEANYYFSLMSKDGYYKKIEEVV